MIHGHLAMLKSAYKMARKKKKKSQHNKDQHATRDGDSRQGVIRQLWQGGAQWKDVSSPSSPEGLQDNRGTWA